MTAEQVIPDSACGNCGSRLAWRSGVGRVVITHATGHDRCQPSSPVAKLTEADQAKAQAALDEWAARIDATPAPERA